MRRRSRFLFTLASLLLAVAPAAAAMFTVNDTADAVDAAPGDGTCATAGARCTLRAAIQEANAHTGPDTIMVPAGTYLLTIAGRGEDAAATGDLDITDDVTTITGAGAASTILDGNGIDRIFEIANPAAVVAISSLTIRNGDPGPVPGDADGGGVYNQGTLTLTDVIVADSTSADSCAGSGTLTSQGHNLDSGNTCGFTGPGDLVDMDPRLGPLQDNGGPTPTQALLPGSPAIDAGGDDCPPPLTDQRGFSRPADGNGDGIATCDIGAFELGAAPPCPAGANFPSIDCRLDELIQTVQTVVPAGALRDGLGRILTSAKVQTGQAEQALANGKRRREKSMLGRANGSLGKFSARLRTRKAQKQIPGVALTGMKTAAGQLRHDLVMLRSSS